MFTVIVKTNFLSVSVAKTAKMNTENTSQEGATDIKIEKESDDEVETAINLYVDHEIKEEMVIGPVVLQEVVNATNCCEDLPVAKKIKLEVKDEKTDQVEPKKEIIEDNTEETISNTDIKSERTVKNEEQTKTLQKYNQTPGIACNDCGQKFRKICELAQHIVSHEKIKQDNNFKCKECTYQTGSQVSLEQHNKLHDIDRIFASDRSKLSLLNDRPKEKEYFCSECEYVSPTKSYLEQHLRTHTGEKPFPCSECKYKGATKNALTRHLRSHTGEKTYSCSKCKYECFDKSVMSRHLRTHTDKKTFSCSECKYKCANKHYLKKHFRVHSGQNPYLCSVCLYGCGDKNTLAIHLRKHTNEKPYSCSECEYKCANKSYLKVHLRTHTGEKPYSCSKCHYKCSDKSALYRHLCHVAKNGKMKTENTSTEGATDKNVEKESDDEVETEINLYADHETKEEMVIGPVVLQEVVNAMDFCDG